MAAMRRFSRPPSRRLSNEAKRTTRERFADSQNRVLVEAHNDWKWPIDSKEKRQTLELFSFHEHASDAEKTLRRVCVGRFVGPDRIRVGQLFTDFSRAVACRVQLVGQRRVWEKAELLEVDISEVASSADLNVSALRPYPADFAGSGIAVAILRGDNDILTRGDLKHWDALHSMQLTMRGTGPTEMFLYIVPCYEGPIKFTVATEIGELLEAVRRVWPAGDATALANPESISLETSQSEEVEAGERESWSSVDPRARFRDIIPAKMRLIVKARGDAETSSSIVTINVGRPVEVSPPRRNMMRYLIWGGLVTIPFYIVVDLFFTVLYRGF